MPRVSLVTGGARRVGAVVARALAARGDRVAIHHHASADEADALVAELPGSRAFAADLSDRAAARSLVDEVVAWGGGLDVLVANASWFARVPMLGGDDAKWDESWDTSLAVNLVAPAVMARHAAGALQARGGVVITMLDIATRQAWPGFPAYGAAKAGLEWLTRTMALALAPRARAVGIAPGFALPPVGASEADVARLVAQIPLQRPGTPEDVARAIVYAVESPYVTGTVLTVDGGRSAASGEGA